MSILLENLKSQINKIQKDEFGRPSGILLVYKPVGVSAHDVVNTYREKYGTKRVGHAGALDIFASGLLIILIGKCTKLSNDMLNLDKGYKARLLLGIETETQDTEGKITNVNSKKKIEKKKIIDVLTSFKGNYKQYVSIYSSVKIKGQKLRKIMRSERFKTEILEQENKKILRLWDNEKKQIIKDIQVPQRIVKIYKINFISLGVIKGVKLDYINKDDYKISDDQAFQFVDFSVECSKGTYIRQLGEDIGVEIGLPAHLLELERTSIGELGLSDVFKPELEQEQE